MEAKIEDSDMRTQLIASRKRIVRGIYDHLRIYLPISDHECMIETWNMAMRFEADNYRSSNTESDYIRAISVKLLLVATKRKNGAIVVPMPSDPQRPVVGLDTLDGQTSWPIQSQLEYRVNIVFKIWDTVKLHLCNLPPEEAINMTASLEEEAYTSSTSQSDYLHKLSLKILALESKNENSSVDSSVSSISSSSNQNSST
ncbi:hypothetical protein ACHQM5_019206 [Ranunculus cassubicifolius]